MLFICFIHLLFQKYSKELQELELPVTGVAAFRTAGDNLSDLWNIEGLIIMVVVMWFVVVGFMINMSRF